MTAVFRSQAHAGPDDIYLLQTICFQPLIAAADRYFGKIVCNASTLGYSMRTLQDFRLGKPGFYPDQTIYAEFACAAFGLDFHPIDPATGLVFSVASPVKRVWFGAGRCSWFPQNNATASSLATDKYFANAIL